MSVPGSKCRSGCPDGDCESYAACLKGSGVRVAYCNSTNGYDATKQKKWSNELSAYRDARAAGIQPAGTSMKQIDQANRISDQTGSAFSGR